MKGLLRRSEACGTNSEASSKDNAATGEGFARDVPEIRKPAGERKIPIRQIMRAEAIEVWERYEAKADRASNA
jgi:hypothetical protein